MIYWVFLQTILHTCSYNISYTRYTVAYMNGVSCIESTIFILYTKYTVQDKKNVGQGKNMKMSVSSYFHIYEGGVILG